MSSNAIIKKYSVKFPITGTIEILVEAESEEEAKSKAIDSDDYHDLEFESVVSGIAEIKKL